MRVEFLPKQMNPLVKGVIRKAIEKDPGAARAYCEGGGAQA